MTRSFFIMLVGVASWIAPTTAEAQIQFPDLSIEGSSVTASVTFDSEREVYIYRYTVAVPESSKAPVSAFTVDVSGNHQREQSDPLLRNLPPRISHRDQQPQTTLPVGLLAPSDIWMTGVSKRGWAIFATVSSGAEIPAGQTREFRIESRFPPGERTAKLAPSKQPLLTFMESLPETLELDPSEIPSGDSWDLYTETVGPIDPAEVELFDGRGQNPAEVNKFLQFGRPVQNRVEVVGASSYQLVVYYGVTTDPQSLSASLNGMDISDLFSPRPSGGDAVLLNLAPGRNTLKLSIEGKKSSGATAKDSDTLTFTVN